MPIRARIPSLSDWKAQVKCQTGCPVSTDAGRYAGRLEGFADDLSTAIQRRLAERG